MTYGTGTNLEVTWAPSLNVPIRHVNLTETLEAIMQGIEEAASGKIRRVDVDSLPTDDDD